MVGIILIFFSQRKGRLIASNKCELAGAGYGVILKKPEMII